MAVDQLYNVPETVAPAPAPAGGAGGPPPQAVSAAPAPAPAPAPGFFAMFTRLFSGGGGAAAPANVTLYKVVYSVFPSGKFYKGGAAGAAGAAGAPAGSPKKEKDAGREAVRFTEFNDFQVRSLPPPPPTHKPI